MNAFPDFCCILSHPALRPKIHIRHMPLMPSTLNMLRSHSLGHNPQTHYITLAYDPFSHPTQLVLTLTINRKSNGEYYCDLLPFPVTNSPFFHILPQLHKRPSRIFRIQHCTASMFLISPRIFCRIKKPMGGVEFCRNLETFSMGLCLSSPVAIFPGGRLVKPLFPVFFIDLPAVGVFCL